MSLATGKTAQLGRYAVLVNGVNVTPEEVVTKALVRLQALCVTMRRIHSNQASEMYVGEYEHILGQVAEVGIDVVGFEIPDAAIPGLEHGARNCDRDFFDMRLAGLLVHLSATTPKGADPDPRPIERILLELDAWKDEDVPF